MGRSQFICQKAGALKGSALIPGDKSISHRAIMLGAIAKGTTIINGFLQGEDCLATLKAFQSMGVNIEGPVSQRVIINGVGKDGLVAPKMPIDCGNSGTTIRLLTGLLAGQSFDSTLVGDASLTKRPMERVSKPLTVMGAEIITNNGCPPVTIRGGQKLHGIHYKMPVASAQVKSAILLAGLYAEGETSVSEPTLTRDHTERMLTAFSYPIRKTEHTVTISPDHELIGTDIIVPGDISSAAFFMVAASIIPGSDITLKNIGLNPTRTGVIEILQSMGASLDIINKRLCGEEPVADLRVRYAPLEGVDIPASLVPSAIDEFPAIFVAAAAAKGQTLLHGARELRVKESDRIAVMVEGLQRMGIECQAFEDGVYIEGGKLQGGEINSYGDHRIAMAFVVAASICKHEVTIAHAESVRTSFPQFQSIATSLGMHVTEENRDG
ncbi:3-phosphoshikimate 1-carboxyvinyltransferase [Legionella sp. W05-934-2]|uniref:3-phosphoshikimate 1-carboxyvinyltransferase n=1 Tax=Legionella sp. W05-934-2 TaxID=1198649 RepID=UPI003462FF33